MQGESQVVHPFAASRPGVGPEAAAATARGHALRFWLPVLAMLLGVALAAVVLRSSSAFWGFLAVYHAPFGAFTAIPAARALGFSALTLLLFMAYLRLVGALFFVWNTHWLRRAPWLGARLARAEAKGHALWNRHPWLRRAGLVGLALWVLIPFAGTGLITGAMIARLSGFSWLQAWGALAVGALVQLSALVLVVYTGWGLLPWV